MSHPEAGTHGVPIGSGHAPSEGEDGADCTITQRVATARGWHLAGFNPGPAFREMVALRRRRLAAVTTRRLCTSDNSGLAWTERLVAADVHATLDLRVLDRRGGLLAVAQVANGDSRRVSEVFVSRDGDGERWTQVALPLVGQNAVRSIVSDGVGRMYGITATQFFASDDDGAHWQGPRALPGREAREVSACGAIVLAHVRIDDGWFYLRTFDRGVTWRPFRLGALGLEGDRSVVRCITERGGLEAGRPPVPSAWSWDGGQRWGPSGYDPVAVHLARAAEEPDSSPAGELPRCFAGQGGFIECVDTGRSRLVDSRGTTHAEVHAPSLCEHVRQVDARRTMAFGPDCGLFLSADRGGLWRRQSQSVTNPRVASFAGGRGGFVAADVAWRLDGGVWWTFNRGATWQPFVSVYARALERGVFVNPHDGVFAMNNGWVVATHDGGRTFTYVLRGNVEQIVATRRAVVVTTDRNVRVSPDGGHTWLASGSSLPSTALEPAVAIVGPRREIAVASGPSVVQRGSEVRLGDSPEPLVTGLPTGYLLVAAHLGADGVDRVLLEGGAILARD